MPENASPRHLLILSPPGGKPLQFELKGKRVGLGRASDNHICVEFGQISASHLEFELVDGNYLLRDLGSTNGVTVNGKRVEEPVKIKDGDRLMIGRTIPAHYLVVAAGERPTAAATYSSKEEQDQAATFASMDEKIHKLEGEAHELEAQISALKADYDQTKVDHDKALEGIKSAEARLREKESAGAGVAELDALQGELLEQTRRFKVLASDLDGQKQQLDKLYATPQPARAAEPSAPPSPLQASAPLKPTFATPAPISHLPVAAPSPATSPPVQISEALIAVPAAVRPEPLPAVAAPVPTPQPAQPAPATPANFAPASASGGATPQIPAAAENASRAKLQVSGDSAAPPRPTMKISPEGSAAARRPGLHLPKKPPGQGPKTVKLDGS